MPDDHVPGDLPDDELRARKERAAERLLRLPGVNGVGLGGRERAGRPTGQLVLKVFVDEKLPPDAVPEGGLVPEEVEGLPTDVVALGEAEPDQAPTPPTGTPEPPLDQRDLRRYRPLVGGGRLQIAITGKAGGTLGCFVIDPADPEKVYALTNEHVMESATNPPTVGTTKVGQPTNQDSVTKCCSHIIGTYAGGGKDPLRDAALVRLEAGMQWKADILEIGNVTGTHTVTPAEAATLAFQVCKRGQRSGLTGGVVEAVSVTRTIAGVAHTNLLLVRPNPDLTVATGTPVYFSTSGDSGAAVVDATNRVVGLHFARISSGANVGSSVSSPIADCIAQFQAVEGLTVEVAIAAAPGEVRTVPGGAMVAVPPEVASALAPGPAVPELKPAPAASPATSGSRPGRVPIGGWLPGLAPPAPAVLATMQRDLDRSEAGRALITAWLEHQTEILELLERNRRVATAWHRNGGSALFQLLVRMLDDPCVALPETLSGRPLAEVLDRVRDAFARHGSAALRRDVEAVRALLPDLGGLTYPQVVAHLGGG